MVWFWIALILGIAIVIELVYFFMLTFAKETKEQSIRDNSYLSIVNNAVVPVDNKPIAHAPVIKGFPMQIPNAKDVKVNFIGSKMTNTYHKSSCRFSKLIKPEFRIENSNKSYFVKNKFKSCHSCISPRNSKRK